MLKFRKDFNKITSILVFVSILFLSIAELYPFSEDSLRIPIGQRTAYERINETTRRGFFAQVAGIVAVGENPAVGSQVQRIESLTTEIIEKRYKNRALITLDFEAACNSLTSLSEQEFLIVRDKIVPALKSALFQRRDDEVSSVAAGALIAIVGSKFATDELRLKIFKDLSEDFCKLKPKAVYDDLKRADTVFKIKWKTADVLMKIASRLPPYHPYHRLMSNFRGRMRKLDLMSRDFSFGSLMLIYSNKDFSAFTNTLPVTLQFSIARAVDLILNMLDKDVTGVNVSRALPLIMAAMDDARKKIFLYPDTYLIIFYNEEKRHDPGHIIELAKSTGVTNIKSPSGAYKKFSIDTLIRNAPIDTVVWLQGEGRDGENFIGKEGEAGCSISYQELAKAMMVFAKRHDNSLKGMVLVLDFCYAANFAYNIIKYLKTALEKGQIKDIPLIISASDINSRSLNTNLLYKGGVVRAKPLWLSEGSYKKRITFGHIMDSVGGGIEFEAFTYFFPMERGEIDKLRRALTGDAVYNIGERITAFLSTCL